MVYANGEQPIWATGRYPDKVGAIGPLGEVTLTGKSISIPLTTKDLGLDHYIQTSVEMNANRQVAGHTVLTCTNKLIGFTAGVRLIYADAQGKPIGVWPSSGSINVPPWGIGQAPIIGAAHTAPPGTTSINLVMFWAPKDPINQLIAAVDAVISGLESAAQFITTFCQQHPDLCASVAQILATAIDAL